jgi:TatD DNase family protein
MIDVHCHLEQKEYDDKRDEIIENLKRELKAVITCCAHPKDFELTLELVKNHPNFVFATAGIHPEYIKEISEKEKDEFLERIKSNKKFLVAIGEVGLDYHWIKEEEFRKKQREWLIEFINLSKEVKLPLIIHCRNADDDCLKILETNDAKKVLWHLFGAKHLITQLVENNYFISIGPILLRSKKHKKIIRDYPLELIMTETDSPWFGVHEKIGYPTNVKYVIEKIAEIKKKSFEVVEKITETNALKFFSLSKF